MKKSTKTAWRKSAIQGLYEHRPAGTPETVRGTFYSRFSVNGKPTFRSLETSVFEHAKLKHAKRMADVEKDRPRGGDLGGEFKTLGALFREVERRMKQNRVSRNTEVGRANNLARLKRHWESAARSNFNTFLARNVDATLIGNLRDYLLTKAPWKYNFGKSRHGFKSPVVKDTRLVVTSELGHAIKRACKRLGLPHVRVHDLRHFFASACFPACRRIVCQAAPTYSVSEKRMNQRHS